MGCQLKAVQSDPNGLSAKQPGSKLDKGKAPVFQGLLQYFPRACKAVADVSGFGASKYSWGGWGTAPDGINRYSDAMCRHILAEQIEGPIDAESQSLHKSQIAWNALAVLELYLREIENKEQK